ncbi:MAG: 30S ribosomal protein S6, partial [Acidobacteriota bacterium]
SSTSTAAHPPPLCSDPRGRDHEAIGRSFMTRTYELGFIVEPRQTDDEVQAITERFTGMLQEAGSTITYVDHWGKRKLAYPIQKFNEGRYVFVYVSADGEPPPWPNIERLMLQDERILRHLIVRTDHDLKRAFRKGKVKPHVPGTETEGAEEGAEEAAVSPEAPAAAASAEPAAAEPESAEAGAETTNEGDA